MTSKAEPHDMMATDISTSAQLNKIAVNTYLKSPHLSSEVFTT